MTRSYKPNPIMLGVVGDSAAGKTTLTAGIARTIGLDRVSVICTDDYHRYDRRQRTELGITPLQPACNYLDMLAQHLSLLRRGEPVLKPVYDHQSGTFAPPVYVEPREFIIAEGLLGFSNAALRSLFDVRIYLDPVEELRQRWKVRRDTAKRGYAPEQVLEELRRREPDSREFIQPQRAHADIVVRFEPPTARDSIGPQDDTHLDARLVLRASLPHPDLSAVVSRAETESGRMRLSVGRDGPYLAEFLHIAGDARERDVLDLEQHIQSHLGRIGVPEPESIGIVPDGAAVHHSKPLALTQLLVAYHLLRMRHAPDGTFPRPAHDEQRVQTFGDAAAMVECLGENI
ncbi:MAG TPA: phosphoribulokinase [Chloroflexota bacterium]|jgi:phosphoribulokinase|nr:phosphoribulokinase [Chloroflexota bacterium]